MPSVILRIVLFANLLLLAMPAEASWRDVNCGFLFGGKEYLTAGGLDAINLRESQQEYVEDYNSGLDMGDLLSCLVSSAEISGGSHMTSAGLATSATGLAVAPATAGATTTVSAGGAAVAAGGMAIRAHGVAMASQMLMNSGSGRGKMPTRTSDLSHRMKPGSEKVEVIQGSGEKARKVVLTVPKGFKKLNQQSHGQKVYTDGKLYISPDKDIHKGGGWKVAKSIESLEEPKLRIGTYNKDWQRIAD